MILTDTGVTAVASLAYCGVCIAAWICCPTWLAIFMTVPVVLGVAVLCFFFLEEWQDKFRRPR